MGLVAALIVVWLVAWLFSAWHKREARDLILRQGLSESALVVDAYTETDDDENTDSFVTLYVSACECRVTKEVTTIDGHPIDSRMPIRVDPAHHRNVEVLEDRPKSSWDGGIGWVVAGTIVALLVAVGWVVRARERNRIVASGWHGRYAFDVWKRTSGDKVSYKLALYQRHDVQRTSPFRWVPVASIYALDDTQPIDVWCDRSCPDARMVLRNNGRWIKPKGPRVAPQARPVAGNFASS